MRSLRSRIEHLERRTSGSRQSALRMVIMPSGSPYGEDFERTCRALDRCGFAQGRCGIFLDSNGLSEDEWEEFRRAYDEEAPSRVSAK